MDHHQGARRSYPKVTTDNLLVRYTVVLWQHACVRCWLCPCSTVDVYPALLGLVPSIKPNSGEYDVLPDDGTVGPKHVAVILKLILICVEGFKV